MKLMDYMESVLLPKSARRQLGWMKHIIQWPEEISHFVSLGVIFSNIIKISLLIIFPASLGIIGCWIFGFLPNAPAVILTALFMVFIVASLVNFVLELIFMFLWNRRARRILAGDIGR